MKTTYEGDVKITEDTAAEWEAKLKGVKKITGNVHVYGTLNAPLLAECAEVSVFGGATLNAPLLKKEKCGISYDVLNARIRKSLQKKYISKGYLLADDILSRIISKRKSGKIIIWKTNPIGRRNKIQYVVQRGEIYSHGETVKQATRDMRYKLDPNRDVSEYKKWTLATVKPIADMIGAYRCISGSCETGTRQWCEGKKLPARLSVRLAIRATRGAYHAGNFANFFKAAK